MDFDGFTMESDGFRWVCDEFGRVQDARWCLTASSLYWLQSGEVDSRRLAMLTIVDKWWKSRWRQLDDRWRVLLVFDDFSWISVTFGDSRELSMSLDDQNDQHLRSSGEITARRSCGVSPLSIKFGNTIVEFLKLIGQQATGRIDRLQGFSIVRKAKFLKSPESSKNCQGMRKSHANFGNDSNCTFQLANSWQPKQTLSDD